MAVFDEKGLFLRDLSEVHLLFDFISGRAGKSLDQLGGIFKFDLNGPREAALTSEEVVEEICKIRYPPEDRLKANAQQAAFMVVVKDKLNDLAYPARGLTIAFTSMFSGVALEPQTICEAVSDLWCFGSADRKLAKEKSKTTANAARPAASPQPEALVKDPVALPPAKALPQPAGMSEEEKTTYSAVLAFPKLERQARKFRRYYNRLPWWGIVLVVLIAWVSWDCSVTSAITTKISLEDSERMALFSTENRFIPTAANCASPPAPGATDGGAGSIAAPDETSADFKAQVCAKEKILRDQETAARDSLRAIQSKIDFLHPVAIGVRLYTVLSLGQGGSQEHADVVLENTFTAVLNAFNTIFTPLLFGWLGTLVAVARSISSKARDSVLAPRDYQIAKVSSFLGMAAGLTVGLIYNPMDPSGALTKSLGGTISVSAAMLSFLAGLGSEAFFNFVDSVISHLFPTPTLSPAGDQSKKTP